MVMIGIYYSNTLFFIPDQLNRSKSLTRSIRKSFQCIPKATKSTIIDLSESDRSTLDLHCIV